MMDRQVGPVPQIELHRGLGVDLLRHPVEEAANEDGDAVGLADNAGQIGHGDLLWC
jgi:hypothetical protein